jgi:hypothetical protein
VNVNDLFELSKVQSPLVLCIDVEGGELAILQQVDLGKFVPDYIVVEEWEPPLTKETQISRYLSDHGYKVQGVAGMSSIYVIRK